jgi:hypothetical protein
MKKSETWIFGKTCDIHGHVLLKEVLYAIVNNRVEISGKSPGHTWRANYVFQDQVPSDYKCHEFAYCHICINVSRAGFRHTSAKLSIAQASQNWGYRCNNKRNNNWRSSDIFNDWTGKNVNAGTKCWTNSFN